MFVTAAYMHLALVGFAVKDVVLQLKPKLSKKLLVSVVAGTKLKDLQVGLASLFLS